MWQKLGWCCLSRDRPFGLPRPTFYLPHLLLIFFFHSPAPPPPLPLYRNKGVVWHGLGGGCHTICPTLKGVVWQTSFAILAKAA
jgi:hypothetical protein